MNLQGLLFFPVTPFDNDGEVAEKQLADHVARGVTAGAGGVFVACGTGEFHALTSAEVETCAAVAVQTVAGAVPVLAGAGGPVAQAVDQVRRIERAGADGVLLMPPYLVGGSQQGLIDYVSTVAAAGDLPVIVYQRATVVFEPWAVAALASVPNVIGLKDGLGDIERMHRIVRRVESTWPGFQFFNGLPTAEMTMHAYRGLGVSLYSSAVFAFAPEVATTFHRALSTGDDVTAHHLIDDFFAPLVELRDEVPGYAVSLVKAAVRMRGLDVGGVRPPLVDPLPEHAERLGDLLERGLRAVGAAV
ncbi:5-dehydro-4-deoxyglucarate dehydratase [Streptomyces sp. 8N114]|uniref:5-dehydro-4-deoxyglucarate dehydratase n=1 Tax=Streptomyces sp. 8N114 TaxID=3457419 RepID=UPI003FD54C81